MLVPVSSCIVHRDWTAVRLGFEVSGFENMLYPEILIPLN